jgi:hypothetical protein
MLLAVNPGDMRIDEYLISAVAMGAGRDIG